MAEVRPAASLSCWRESSDFLAHFPMKKLRYNESNVPDHNYNDMNLVIAKEGKPLSQKGWRRGAAIILTVVASHDVKMR